MKKLLRRASLLFALVLALPAAASAQETQDSTRLPAQLREARAALNKAYTSLAPDAALAHYADDVYVLFGQDEHRGKQAAAAWLDDALRGLAALRFSPSRFTISENEVVEIASYAVVLPDGSESGGTAETVWRRQGGAWKVARLVVQ